MTEENKLSPKQIRDALSKKFKREISPSVAGRETCRKIYPTNIPSLDLAIGNGGLVGGRIVEIWGQNGTGKSLLTHTIAGLHQKINGGMYGFCDVEGTWDNKFAESAGVDISDEKLILVEHPKDGDVLSGEDFFEAAVTLIQSGVDFVALDSVSALSSSSHLSSAVNESKIAARGLLISNGLKRIQPYVSQKDAVMWFISQISTDINTMKGSGLKPASGMQLPFHASYRFEIRKVTDIEEKIKTPKGIQKEIIGVRIGIKIVKNKTCGRPRCISPIYDKDPSTCHVLLNIILKPCETEKGIVYQRGVDIYEDYFITGIKTGTIHDLGSGFYEIKDLKIRGKAKFIQELREREDILKHIKENATSEVLHDGEASEASDQDGY